MDFNHVSVLLDETIEGLNINPDGIYFDGTLGGGGHSYEILKRLTGKGILIGVDQDGDAIEAASEKLNEFDGKFQLVRSNYSEIETILNDLKIRKNIIKPKTLIMLILKNCLKIYQVSYIIQLT